MMRHLSMNNLLVAYESAHREAEFVVTSGIE